MFIEGDELHSAANISRMSGGQPLDDAARAEWLDKVLAAIDDVPPERIGVVACSALKRRYREHLRDGRPRVMFIYLAVAVDVARSRMLRREDHFMPPALIDSQFAALEPPHSDEGILILDGTSELDEIVERACAVFNLICSGSA